MSVQLDGDAPEYMDGVFRCGSVISQDEDGSDQKDHQNLIDNTEFHSADELISYGAGKLGVSNDIFEIEA